MTQHRPWMLLNQAISISFHLFRPAHQSFIHTHLRMTPVPSGLQMRRHCRPYFSSTKPDNDCSRSDTYLAVLMMTPRSSVDSFGLAIGFGASRTIRAAVNLHTLKDPISCKREGDDEYAWVHVSQFYLRPPFLLLPLLSSASTDSR